MKYTMIGAWKFSIEGLLPAEALLKGGGSAKDALEKAICVVEDNPDNHYVGFGSVPNQNCEVELDAAYMDGDTLMYGGIMGVRNIKNPIKVAIDLSKHQRNCLLCGSGAESYANRNGFEFANMLNDYGRSCWSEEFEKPQSAGPDAAGHDTECMVAMDSNGTIAVGISTSGLGFKHPGRVGDSPVIGSGFYCDSRYGGAAATGIGEDIMRGCVSREIVSAMKQGLSAQEACETVVLELYSRLLELGFDADNISVIAVDRTGAFGAATTRSEFSFSAFSESMEATLFICRNSGGVITTAIASEEDIAQYKGD